MNKRFCCVVLFILVLMLGNVFADAGVPVIKEYKVEVTNPEGSYLYNQKLLNDKYEMIISSKVGFGDILRASYDTDFNGKHYVMINKEHDSGEIMGEFLGYIPLEDVRGVTEGLSLSEYKILEEPIKLTVLKSEGINIYEWPSLSYDIIGNIPYKNVVNGYRTDANEGWYYISSDGVEGFICEFDGALGTKNEEGKSFMTTFRGASVLNEDGKIIGELPKNTIFNDYYNLDSRSWKIYVSYNGLAGTVDVFDVAYDMNEEWLKDRKKYTVQYDGIVLIGIDNSITDIPKGTVLDCKYMERDNGSNVWAFTSYGDKKGWVCCLNIYNFDLNEEYNKNIISDGLIEIQKVVDEIKKGSPIESGEAINEVEIVSGEETTSGENKSIETNQKKGDSLTSTQIVLICVLCALVASATTAVVIILINKKKK